jgi:hypothetical protein
MTVAEVLQPEFSDVHQRKTAELRGRYQLHGMHRNSHGGLHAIRHPFQQPLPRHPRHQRLHALAPQCPRRVRRATCNTIKVIREFQEGP